MSRGINERRASATSRKLLPYGPQRDFWKDVSLEEVAVPEYRFPTVITLLKVEITVNVLSTAKTSLGTATVGKNIR